MCISGYVAGRIEATTQAAKSTESYSFKYLLRVVSVS